MKKIMLIPFIVCLITFSISCSHKLHENKLDGYWQLNNGTIETNILSQDTLTFRRVLIEDILSSDSSHLFPHLKIGNADPPPTGGFYGRLKNKFWFQFVKDNNHDNLH